MSDIKLDFAKQDGLLPVIVTDYKTGQVLMLAYMNEEAYRLTLETKQMHYWSRSRNELWQKGATRWSTINTSNPLKQIVIVTHYLWL